MILLGIVVLGAALCPGASFCLNGPHLPACSACDAPRTRVVPRASPDEPSLDFSDELENEGEKAVWSPDQGLDQDKLTEAEARAVLLERLGGIGEEVPPWLDQGLDQDEISEAEARSIWLEQGLGAEAFSSGAVELIGEEGEELDEDDIDALMEQAPTLAETMAQQDEGLSQAEQAACVELGLGPEALSSGLVELIGEEGEDLDDNAIDSLMDQAPTLAESIAQGGQVELGDLLPEEGDDLNERELDLLMDRAPTQAEVMALEKEMQSVSEGRDGDETADDVTEQGMIEQSMNREDEEEPLEGRAVGIDLGTTNSAVAVIEAGEPVIVLNDQGKRTTPSVVAMLTGRKALVGELAVRQQEANPEDTFSSVKRVMGRTRTEAKRAGIKLGTQGVHKGFEQIRLKCPAWGGSCAPEDVSAEVIKQLVNDAEGYLGGDTKVRRAVVTVPAYFLDHQCEATKRAGMLAGLEKVKLMREPEAAALAYGLNLEEDELILVFDLGGGTFDVSVLEVGGGVVEVIATAGESHLGGNDFDLAIAEWLCDEVVEREGRGADPRNEPFAMRRLLTAAEEARIKLTTQKAVPILVPFLEGSTGIDTVLTRSKMEQLCKIPLQKILPPLRKVAIMADISLPGESGAFFDAFQGEDYDEEENRGKSQKNQVLGLKQLRKQQNKDRRAGKANAKARKKQAQAFSKVQRSMGGNAKLRQFPQGRNLSQVLLVGGATRMPCVRRLVETCTGLPPRAGVNPDEAVALGAAIYAGILEGEVEGMDVLTAWQAAVLRMMALSGRIK
ncbi:unnamed protein product [Chrysoparadoxa australica]